MAQNKKRDEKDLITFKRLLALANTVVMDGEVSREGLFLGYKLTEDNYRRLYLEICRINDVEFDEDADLPDDFQITVGTILFKIELDEE